MQISLKELALAQFSHSTCAQQMFTELNLLLDACLHRTRVRAQDCGGWACRGQPGQGARASFHELLAGLEQACLPQ